VNYLVIRDGSHTLYVHGGGAGDSLDYLFAPGPDVVLRWLARRPEDVTDQWLGDELCTGGVLIDTDRRVLLMFAEMLDYAYRAAVLDAYHRTWPGWEIRWAYDGIGDLVAYTGGDRAAVRADRTTTSLAAAYPGHDPESALAALITVDDGGGRYRAYGLGWELVDRRPFWAGPVLLDWLTAGQPLEWCDELPAAGLHLDPATRTAGLWSIRALRGLLEEWPSRWPGWTLRFWGDDHGSQAALCGDLLGELPPVVLEPGLRGLARRLIRHWPVRSALAEAGWDVDRLRAQDVGGMRAMLDVQLTAEELARTADAVIGR
jgi:hypothetical protein